MSQEATEAEVHEHLSQQESADAVREELRQEIGQQYSTQVGELQQQIDRLNQTIAAHEATIKTLEQNNATQATEIENLKKEPAAEHTAGAAESSAPAKNDKPWMNLPINQRRVVLN